MSKEEHRVYDLTTKVSAWMANLIAVAIVASVSTLFWIVIQVTSIQGKLEILGGLYTKENAATASALQELTDAKQNNEISRISNKVDAAFEQAKKNTEEVEKVKNWVYNLQKKGKFPE